MNKLYKYLQDHPALNKSELAREMGMKDKNPSAKFSEYLESKSGRVFNANFAFKLACVLTRYGLVIDGWMFEEYDEDSPGCLFAYQWKDEEFKSIDKEDHFEYTRVFYREHWDIFDFFEFVKE